MVAPNSSFPELTAQVANFESDQQALLRSHSPADFELHGFDFGRRIADRHKQDVNTVASIIDA